MSTIPLKASVPANNEKIVVLYNKVKSGQLNPSPDFQRKLVWKPQHKIKFIETILLHYPFPEIYLAPDELDIETKELKDLIVDGQQRVSTIVSFIDNEDVFSLEKTKVKFTDLDDDEKKRFLNYEVSVRYLKDANPEQIKEIFQRINDTEYSLNAMERMNAQWGESEFVCYAKQTVEEELTVDLEMLEYRMPHDVRERFLSFFHSKGIFTDNDNDRMLTLQYVITLMSTLVRGEYFGRNTKNQEYIKLYNESFDDAEEMSEELTRVVDLIDLLNLDERSYFFNKSNIFTLICELYKVETSSLDIERFGELLETLQSNYSQFQVDPESVDPQFRKYYEYVLEGVNEVSAREYRGKVISGFIKEATSASA